MSPMLIASLLKERLQQQPEFQIKTTIIFKNYIEQIVLFKMFYRHILHDFGPNPIKLWFH